MCFLEHLYNHLLRCEGSFVPLGTRHVADGEAVVRAWVHHALDQGDEVVVEGKATLLQEVFGLLHQKVVPFVVCLKEGELAHCHHE